LGPYEIGLTTRRRAASPGPSGPPPRGVWSIRRLMRLRGLLFALVALAACDDKPAPTKPEPTTSAAPTPPPTPPPTPTPTAPAPATATPTASAAAPPMPPRPVPIGSSGPIQPSAPPEQQMMAISYTLAMVAPRPGDPPSVDATFLEDLVKKLEGAVHGVGKGK